MSARKDSIRSRTLSPAPERVAPMAMLPNDHHPGPRCSCRECLARYPESPESPRFHDHESGTPIDGLPDPLPCPFCGSRDFGGIVDTGTPDRTFHVACDGCGADGPSAVSQLEAAEEWNKAHRSATEEEPERVSLGSLEATDLILSGLAILECYTNCVPDERAKDRYVLWSARDKFEEAYEIVQMLPSTRGDAVAPLSADAQAPTPSEGVPAGDEPDAARGLLDFLNNLRMKVEQARATAACVVGALHHLNMTASEEAAQVLTSYVDNALCEQVDKLDKAISRIAQGVSHA